MYDVAMRPLSFLFVVRRSSRPHAVSPSPYTCERRGRVLVECCVSMVLLAYAGALALVVSAGTTHLVDASRQHDVVLRTATAQLSRALSTPCLVSGAVAREAAGPRAVLDVVSTDQHQVRTITVDAWWQASAFANGAWHRHATTVSGWCE